jgi:hypothetical protein
MEVPWESSKALLSLEQSSLIDENAVVLTAHDSLIHEGTTLFVTNAKEREKNKKG